MFCVLFGCLCVCKDSVVDLYVHVPHWRNLVGVHMYYLANEPESATPRGVTSLEVRALLAIAINFLTVLTSVISRMGTMFPRYYINF